MLELSSVNFTEFDVLELFWNRQIPFFSCVLAQLEFAVLVIFILDLTQSFRACLRFYFILSWILFLFVSRGPRAVSFLVLFGLF